MASESTGARIENILIGIFGAVIGGEFVAAMVMAPGATENFTVGAAALAVVCSIVLLLLLRLMRRLVGPLRPSKQRPPRNY